MRGTSVFVITFYSRRDWRRALRNECGPRRALASRKKRTRIKKGKLRLGFAAWAERPLRGHSFSQTNSRPGSAKRGIKFSKWDCGRRTFLGRVSTGLRHANLICCADDTRLHQWILNPLHALTRNLIISNESEVSFNVRAAWALQTQKICTNMIYADGQNWKIYETQIEF